MSDTSPDTPKLPGWNHVPSVPIQTSPFFAWPPDFRRMGRWLSVRWLSFTENLLILAIALGALFTLFQAYEYGHAGFSFSGNIYGANFFMATGFHGAHVIIGTIFLFVCLMRVYRGHFTPERHVGFEAAAWYWHFVDVVWLFLFAAVYIWGG